MAEPGRGFSRRIVIYPGVSAVCKALHDVSRVISRALAVRRAVWRRYVWRSCRRPRDGVLKAKRICWFCSG